MKLDLHLHSYYSDGKLSPKELVAECKKLGLELIALTDHDNVGGIAEALQAGQEFEIKVIPGIEFSVNDGDNKEQHLLGYLIDWQSAVLKDFLESRKTSKITQIEAMIIKLQKIGFQITLDGVLAQARGSLNRSHIAYAIFDDLGNAATLKERFGVETASDFFGKFLKEESLYSVYVNKTRPSFGEVVQLIHQLGGIAVWVHPFWNRQSASTIAEKAATFRKFGLDGLEVLYSRDFHSREKALILHRFAQRLKMHETAGSDFHSFTMTIYNKIADFDTFGIELNLPPRFLEG